MTLYSLILAVTCVMAMAGARLRFLNIYGICVVRILCHAIYLCYPVGNYGRFPYFFILQYMYIGTVTGTHDDGQYYSIVTVFH
jgi:hypothetical protein